jgi:hypothetical protein
MGALFAILTRSTIRLVATLGVVILVLLAGSWMKNEWANWDSATLDLKRLNQNLVEIRTQTESLQKDVLKHVPGPGAPIAAVKEQGEHLAKTLENLDEQIRRIERQNPVASRVPGSPAFIELVRAKAERTLWQQAKDYTDQLLEKLRSMQNCEIHVLNAKARMLEIAAIIYRNLQELDELNRTGGPDSWNPFSEISRRRDAIERNLKTLADEQATATGQYEYIRKACAEPKPMRAFAVDKEALERELQPLINVIAELQGKADNSWAGKLLQPIVDILPTALWIVFGIFTAPIAIKAFAYFVIAPLVGRCRPLRLLPETTGVVEPRAIGEEVGNGRSRSAVSQSLSLRPDEELLVHGDYVQSSAVAGRKNTKWLLAWRMPLTSLAAGLYGLTRFSGGSSEPVVLSSSSDPLQELAVLVLPAGSAVVLQPRCIVGLVRRQSEDIRITRHWRLGHLSSWLTLQLRYIVFHGPVTLVLRGCRGVRVEPVSEGRLINQAATLGFSANVAYSTGRCETFGSYLLGQQELFNDRFSGASGMYIYEETPRRDIKGGITGRGIEGVLDSFLKVVGI